MSGEPFAVHEILARVRREIDADLVAGREPSVEAARLRWPELEPELAALVQERRLLLREGLLDSAGGGGGASAVTGAEDAELVRLFSEVLAPDPPAAPRPDLPHTGVGRFRPLRRAGSHPAGVIHVAADSGGTGLRDLLVLRPEIGKEEGRILLRHAERHIGMAVPGFARLLEVGEDRGIRFLAWEHEPGVTLARLVEDVAALRGRHGLAEVLLTRGEIARLPGASPGPLPLRSRGALGESLLGERSHVEAAAALGRDLALILEAAHRTGLIHGDLAPAAVRVDARGALRVTGIGLRRHRGLFLVEDDVLPLCRAPELAFEDPSGVDWRADLFGLGAVLHALLLLRPPVLLPADIRSRGEAREEARSQLLVAAARLGAVLGPVAGALLSGDPRDRPASAATVADALRRRPGPEVAAPGGGPGAWRRLLRGWGRRKP